MQVSQASFEPANINGIEMFLRVVEGGRKETKQLELPIEDQPEVPIYTRQIGAPITGIATMYGRPDSYETDSQTWFDYFPTQGGSVTNLGSFNPLGGIAMASGGIYYGSSAGLVDQHGRPYIPPPSKPITVKTAIMPSTALYGPLPTLSAMNTEAKFKRLKAEWMDEQAGSSKFERIVLCKSYQRIIGMGPQVLPFLVRELRGSELYWIWALEAIADENPVLPEHEDDFDAVRSDWLDWAGTNGF